MQAFVFVTAIRHECPWKYENVEERHLKLEKSTVVNNRFFLDYLTEQLFIFRNNIYC